MPKPNLAHFCTYRVTPKVLALDYSGTSGALLRYFTQSTGLIIPVEALLILVEFQFFAYPCLP